MSDIKKQGYAGIFIRVFNANNSELIQGVTSIKYTHSERADDASTITIKSKEVGIVDSPDIQENKMLNLVFGYTSGEKQKRQVWIWDIQTEFTTEGVTLRIEAYCKAAYLLLDSSKDVWNNTNLEDMARQIADSSGLEFENEFDEAYVDFAKGSEFDEETNQFTQARDTTSRPRVYRWKNQQVVAANRSKARILQDMKEKEPTPDVVIEGRDDKLILRRRNLKQSPYKSLVWRGEPGNFLQFEPRSNLRLNKKYGISNSVSTWDEENKEYTQGSVGKPQTGITSLGDNEEVTWGQQKAEDIQSALNEDILTGSPYTVDGVYVEEEIDEKDENGNPIIKRRFNKKLEIGDNAFVGWVKRGTRKSNLVLDKKFITVETDVTGRIEQRSFDVIPITKENLPTGDGTPEEEAGAGANRKARNELDLYEANIMVLGDPDLVSGKIVNIKGTGVKYSGNWYIKSATHELETESGYITRLLVCRNSLNSLDNENPLKLKTSQINIESNNGILTEDGTINLLNVPVRND
jgi:hypothetical protein